MRVWLPLIVASVMCSRQAFADEAAPLPSKDIRWYATLGPAVDTGSLPRTSPGMALGFDVRRGGLAARAAASAFLPQVDRASGASVALFDVMPLLCAMGPLSSRFDVGACAGAGAGLLRASVRDESAIVFRPQATALARLDLLLGAGFVVSADAGTILDPLRSPLRLAGVDDAYRPSLFSFRASLGLHVQLW